jgi:hypothetical protein
LDFKVYFLEYVRNNKELTFVNLEKKLRQDELHVVSHGDCPHTTPAWRRRLEGLISVDLAEIRNTIALMALSLGEFKKDIVSATFWVH